MVMRVGRVPYLHIEPFYFDMVRRGIELQEMSPSAVVAAVEHDEIDAGPNPSWLTVSTWKIGFNQWLVFA